MKPQEPIPHNYSMSTLNWIFAISSLGLLGLVFVMVLVDYVKGWTKFQRGFLRLQRERIEQQIQVAQKEQNQGEMAQLDERIRDQERQIARQRMDLREAQRALDYLEGRHYAADQDYRFAKATADAMRYDAEVAALRKTRNWEGVGKIFRDQMARVDQLKIKLEAVTRDRDRALARVNQWFASIQQAEDRKKELNASVDLLRKQLKTVSEDPQFFLLNAPLLDFVNPTLKVDQVVVRDMFIDMNYLTVPRVDRCTTCHRAIDRAGFESRKEAERLQAELELKLDQFQIPTERIADVRLRVEQLKRLQQEKPIPNPYRTHPNLDTFVGSASPHPLQDFGCTSCHRGLDRATDFARAGHMPVSSRMQHRWEKQYGWEAQHFLETPMHPRTYYESACVKCHSGQVTVPRGEKVTRATAMVELYGCYACHKIDNWRFTNLRRPGPDLTGIAEKTTPEWVARWITEPHDFRSTTRMPSFFFQRNMVGPEVPPAEREQNIRFQNAEIQSIVSFLFSKSTRRPWTPGGAGDAARGQELVKSVGCMGCHVVQDTVTDAKSGKPRLARRDDFPLERNYGFNLTGTGTKSNPAWLFHWLKNPRNYYPDAPMPDLRLTDQEAADITAYLMRLQKPSFMRKPLPVGDPKSVRLLLKTYMSSTMTELDSEARLNRMPLRDQLILLGERSVEKYGCYSCHTIEGFERAKPIGTELTIEGSKALHLFDFGFAHDYEAHDGKHEHIIHTVPSWVYNKVRSPRVYDDERAKTYQDKLKMPNFYLTPDEAKAITSVIVGLTEDRVADSRVAAKDPRSRTVAEGKKLVSQHNCRACHLVDGYGRAISQTIEDPGLLPPDLGPEGSRVQSDWLFNFLKDPTVMTMRPWLTTRMPTFHFTDEETNTLVGSFAAEGRVETFGTTRNLIPPAQNVAIGRTVFQMLRCAQCHPTGGAVAAGVDTASLAPDLQLSRVRLRHGWISDWIRRPNEIIPGTKMPTNFPRDPETGGFISPLGSAINSPQFASYKSTLMSHYGSEAELTAAMQDVVGLTNYLRDYIWSIGPGTMRTAAPAPTGVGQPPTPGQGPPITAPALRSSRTDTNVSSTTGSR